MIELMEGPSQSPSLFAKYISERESKNIIEDHRGFMTYMLIAPDTCYIEDAYVDPSYRQSEVAKEMLAKVEEIALSWGCVHLTTSVRPSAFGSTDSLKIILTAGFQLLRSGTDAIFFIKELNHGERS